MKDGALVVFAVVILAVVGLWALIIKGGQYLIHVVLR